MYDAAAGDERRCSGNYEEDIVCVRMKLTLTASVSEGYLGGIIQASFGDSICSDGRVLQFALELDCDLENMPSGEYVCRVLRLPA
jgi:hypothetical protein